MIPEHMAAMQLVGHGGVEKLVYRTDMPVPRPGEGELLVKITATATTASCGKGSTRRSGRAT